MTGSLGIRLITPSDVSTCDEIVHSLPYHFGDAQGRQECAHAVRTAAGVVAVDDDIVVGFLTWKAWFDSAFEITWMAVDARRRGTGIGRALVDHLVTVAREKGARFLLVTTLSPSVAEPGVVDGYERTRSFYVGCGFHPTWEPDGWWNERSQALLMVRCLDDEHG